MSAFRTRLRVEDVDEFAGTWKLTDPLVYDSDMLQRTVVVPADFVTDFASIPRLPFVYWAEGGKGDKAAVVHDWLYSTRAVTRRQADQVLHEALMACGYSSFTANLFYAAVRVGGGPHWKDENLPQDAFVRDAMATEKFLGVP